MMKNLRVIMADRNISITDLSKELEISRNTLTNYYYDRNKNVKLDYVYAIADYFDVTLDELFGRVSYNAGNQLGDKINRIRLEKGMTMEEFGGLLKTSKGTVNNWEKGRNHPNKWRLKEIAELAGITVEEILNQKENEK